MECFKYMYEFLILVALWCGNPGYGVHKSDVNKCRTAALQCRVESNKIRVVQKETAECIEKIRF